MVTRKIYKSGGINIISSLRTVSILPGNLKGLPDESFSMNNTLIFIDEGFLSKLSKYFGEGKYLKFDRFK